MVLKISFHSANFPELQLNKLLQEVKTYGYDAIEINLTTLPYADPHLEVNCVDDQINDLKLTLQKSKLDISALCCHKNLIQENRTKRKEVIQYTKDCIDLASKLGTKIVQGSSGIKPENLDEESAWELLVESTNEIICYADQKGVKFTFEPVIGMLVCDSSTYKKIKSKINQGFLYMNFDPSQLIICDEDLSDFIYSFKEDIIHVHLKDGIGTIEDFMFPPLGKGQINFKEVLKALQNINYKGYLSVEYEAHLFGYGKGFEEVFEKSIYFAKNLLEEIEY